MCGHYRTCEWTCTWMLEADLVVKQAALNTATPHRLFQYAIIGRKDPVHDYIVHIQFQSQGHIYGPWRSLDKWSRQAFYALRILPKSLSSHNVCFRIRLAVSPCAFAAVSILKPFVFKTAGRYSECLHSEVGKSHDRLRLYATIDDRGRS